MDWTSALERCEWLASCSGLVTLEEILSSAVCIGGWMGLRLGMDAVKDR
jgi:hypothetical protein